MQPSSDVSTDLFPVQSTLNDVLSTQAEDQSDLPLATNFSHTDETRATISNANELYDNSSISVSEQWFDFDWAEPCPNETKSTNPQLENNDWVRMLEEVANECPETGTMFCEKSENNKLLNTNTILDQLTCSTNTTSGLSMTSDGHFVFLPFEQAMKLKFKVEE